LADVEDVPVSRRRFLLAAGALVLAGCSSPRPAERRGVSGTNVGIAVFDGVEELDFAGPYEVLTS
jgi:hypothetical protein